MGSVIGNWGNGHPGQSGAWNPDRLGRAFSGPIQLGGFYVHGRPRRDLARQRHEL